jgi:TatD DNase family protein
LPKAIEICQTYKNIYFAIGVHPYDCENFDIELFHKYINHPKCVAIGECGLDYYRLPKDETKKQKNIQKQKEIFKAQIEFAKSVNKPLIVHIRDASSDSKKMLLDYGASKVGGVLHCFNADEQLLSLTNQGFYFGIGGVVTFKNAKKLVNIIPKIPIDRLVVETDAPYLTPEPNRGKRNEPAYTSFVVKKIAQILDIDEKLLLDIILNNTNKLWNLKL